MGAVVPTHVFDRDFASAKPDLMDSLEWAWGMRRGSLNLDTGRNVLFLSATMYSLYVNKKWVLVPTEEDVFRFLDIRDDTIHPRSAFIDLKENSYSYTFVPLQDMEDVYITRQSFDVDGISNGVAVHEFPFEDFPIVDSHINPKFAILHLGAILFQDLDVKIKQSLLKRYPHLQDIENLFSAWTTAPPHGAFIDITYIFPRSFWDFGNYYATLQSGTDDQDHTTPRRRCIPLPRYALYEPFPSASECSDEDEDEDEEPNMQYDQPGEWERSSVGAVRDAESSHRAGSMTGSNSGELTRRRDTQGWTPNRVVGWARDCVPPTTPTTTMGLRRSTRTRKQPKRHMY
ncbi:hypothetical protein CVT24_012884 [Panaeolus cyanescens]|uniref:HNH nuclease domain-containing protein n=1 Tax=Panaeolus cyanescens TaxID=181874 RepID=A0A409W305_9AGAR|nr:hypothetical protein CVT24_012884 [Panaeolus cyanescens]